MKRFLFAFSAVAALVVVGVSTRPALAAPVSPMDIYGSALRDGDLISANMSAGDPDIFIVKLLVGNFDLRSPDVNGYKRLFLNPAIFNMYGHLGGFSRVRQVSASVRDSFETTTLFRNCETNDRRVWAVEVTGEDDGILHHVEINGDVAVSGDRYFFSKVFCINTREDNFYARSIFPYSRLADIPRYIRSQVCSYEGQPAVGRPCCSGMNPDGQNICRRICQPRPACLDASPRCLLAEPAEGWCPWPTVTPTPPPGCYYQQVQCFTTPCNPQLVCPTPTGSQATVQGVTVATLESYPRQFKATITGYLPTPCYTISSSVRFEGRATFVTLTATSTLGPTEGACVQVIQGFSQTVDVGNVYNPGVGTYALYVNNQYWTDYTVY